jgi:hypothetical protein
VVQVQVFLGDEAVVGAGGAERLDDGVLGGVVGVADLAAIVLELDAVLRRK